MARATLDSFQNSCGHIDDLTKLARALSLPRVQLEDLANNASQLYREKKIPKKTPGSFRTLHVPSDHLKRVQRQVNSRIFSTVHWPHFVFGGIPAKGRGTDYIDAAIQHSGASVKAEVDISDFFPSTTYDNVFPIFRDFFRFNDEICTLLCNLTLHQNCLPQGAPTSVALANLAFFQREPQLVQDLESSGTRYTRFIDDIVISHEDIDHSIERERRRIERMIDREEYDLNDGKVKKKERKYSGLHVFGFLVSDAETRVTRREVDRIRVQLKQLEILAKKPNARKTSNFHSSWHKISGGLNKLQRLNHTKYSDYRKRLGAILPLLNDKESATLSRKVESLTRSIGHIKNVEATMRHYFKLRNRVGILSRNHPKTARNLLDALNRIKEDLGVSN